MNTFQCFHLIVNISFQVDKKEKKQWHKHSNGVGPWRSRAMWKPATQRQRDGDRGHCLPVRSGRRCWLYEGNRILCLQRGDCHSTLKTALTYIQRARVCAKLLQLCLTLCNPVDCSPPGSSVHGILQARILEWVAVPSSGDHIYITSCKTDS